MTQQRFQVTANGFVELNGSITVEVDRDTTIAVAPYVVQNYHPYSGNGKSRKRHLYRVRMPVKKVGILFRCMQSLLFNIQQRVQTTYTDQTKLWVLLIY